MPKPLDSSIKVCLWCQQEVSGEYLLGSACPHCGKSPLIISDGTNSQRGDKK